MNGLDHSRFWLLMLFLFSMIGGCMEEDYIEFKPIYRQNEKFFESEARLSDDFLKNIRFVFDFYDVPYRLGKDNTLLIPESYQNDSELIWNYTTKAHDDEWVNHLRSILKPEPAQ